MHRFRWRWAATALIRRPWIRSRSRRVRRVHQSSDFHCVTTWSHCDARWSGFRFAEVFENLLSPRIREGDAPQLVVLRCLDGYRTSLPLEDALAPDVLLADRLDEAPLGVTHGAPLRLVAPAHYGYKNAKHLKAIELWKSLEAAPKKGLAYYMDHPRARVENEERARIAPGFLLRFLYRQGIGSTVLSFKAPLDRAGGR